MHSFIVLLVLLNGILIATFNSNSEYVICSETHCPTIEPLLKQGQKLTDEQYILYTTHKNSSIFMQRSEGHFSLGTQPKINYDVCFDEHSLKDIPPIIGFGGAITDATAMLYHALPQSLQKQFIEAYYGDNGINYSLMRIPVSSNDFSCRDSNNQPSLTKCDPQKSQYSYDDHKNDYRLMFFKLAPEDIHYKIPLAREALKKVHEVGNDLHIYSSIWSAPAWMKDNNNMIHGSLINTPYIKKAYADYLIRILSEYQKLGIYFWGLTVNNEPNKPPIIARQSWQTMYSTPEDQAVFIQDFLGPAKADLEKHYSPTKTYQKINLIINDDDSLFIENRTRNILQNINIPRAKDYVDGVGLHWYTNKIDTNFDHHISQTWQILSLLPDRSRFMLATEACHGVLPVTLRKGVLLGDWGRGEDYAHDIIRDLNANLSGWVDWNQLLNINGGPTWANNNVDAPIIFDEKKQVLYKQPMYFYLGHFAKFIRPGSRQINITEKTTLPPRALEAVVYKVPPTKEMGAHIVVVVLNKASDHSVTFNLYSKNNPNKYINHVIQPNMINTFIFNYF